MRIVTGLLILTFTTSAHADEPKQIKPLIEMTFSVGKDVKGCLERCDTRDQWEEVWKRYQPKEYLDQKQALPKIDFKSHMVIVFCHRYACGTNIHAIDDKSDQIVVRYTQGNGGQFRPPIRKEEVKEFNERMDKHYTFRLTFIVLPATAKTLVLEEGHGGIIGEPREWKELARLEKKAK